MWQERQELEASLFPAGTDMRQRTAAPPLKVGRGAGLSASSTQPPPSAL